jgi:hypothetical protein
MSTASSSCGVSAGFRSELPVRSTGMTVLQMPTATRIPYKGRPQHPQIVGFSPVKPASGIIRERVIFAG